MPDRPPQVVPELHEPLPAPSVRATPELWHHLGVPVLFAALALGLQQDLVFLLGALVVGCTLAAAPLCRRNLRGVGVRRRLPTRARAGQPATIEVEVGNTGPEDAVGLEIEQSHPRQASPPEGRLDVPSLGPGRSVSGRIVLTFHARGRYVLPPASVSSRYPLGAFRARRRAGAPDNLLVWPREGRATAALLARLGGQGESLRPARALARGADDLFGVRGWREGDDPRRLHAPSSARRGEPMVSDWRALPGHETWVVLGRCAGAGTSHLFERGVSIAATLWSALASMGQPSCLLVGAQCVRSGSQGRVLGLDLLALARPRAGAAVEARLRALPTHGAPRHLILVGGPGDRPLLEAARRAAGPRGRCWWLDARPPQSQRWVKGLEG